MNASSPNTDLSAIGPEARKLIVIYPDNEVEEHRRQFTSKRPSTTQSAARIARRVLLGPLWSIPVELAIDALSDKVAGLEVLYTTSHEVEQAGFRLPGYRKLRTLYVMHPMDPSQYFPAASFHRLAFEHKFAEAVRLLVGLGATKLVVQHEHGWSREVVGKATVPIPEEKATVGLTAKGSASAQSKVLFEATYKGKAKAQVPEGLVWYPHERTWQTIAEGRIEGGMDSFSLTLSYTEDFGVSVDLAAKAKDMSIEIGGKFESCQATQWTIHGDFRRTQSRKAA